MKVRPHPILHLPDRPTRTDGTAPAAREAGTALRLEPRVSVLNSTSPFEGNLAKPTFPRTHAYPVGSVHSIPGDPHKETCEGAKLHTYKVLHCNVIAKVELARTPLPIDGQQSVSPAPLLSTATDSEDARSP